MMEGAVTWGTVWRRSAGREATMLDSCHKHPHEMGVTLCRRCGQSWCSTCLVYSYGPKKPPYCMSCAMVAGGVRTSATLPAMSRKQLKAQMRALKAETKAATKVATKAAEDEPQPHAETETETETEAACTQTDWAAPWWEDREPSALAD
jgi:hypothetical protein